MTTEEAQVAPEQEAAPEAVQTEAEQVTAPEAAESTEGQIDDQPAEDQGQTPEAEEEKSASKARRERRKAELERLRSEAEAKEAENAKLKQQMAEYERRAQEAAPQEADFEDYAQYQAALSAHRALEALDQRDKARIDQERQKREAEITAIQAQQQREFAQNWAAQVDDAKTRYADFEAIAQAPDLPITEEMGRMIVMSDFGADVAYHLGTHRAEAARIAKLTPIEQAMAIGRLEATISAPKPRTKTNAPEPISPVKAKASTAKRPEDMTPGEYAKWREKGGTFKL